MANGLTEMFSLKKLIRERISNSVIPTRLLEKFIDILEPLSNEIESWKRDMLDFGIHQQLDKCLTSSGTIDRIETAKKFVRSEDQNVLQHFVLACYFWLTADVIRL
ncbi:hypothetical protein TNCT_272201 [Trichonephila clavata]|uniref:Uncharacterized protein n=1 Tax=Trichonephila clavata TaxID=2740835 RepID=A0A8X6L7T6_TRICU|nr:hypothetical protein TNCT_272201 [Trichonephila clavata]